MKPSVRFGLIGGIVAVVVLFSATFVPADKPSVLHTLPFLLQLVVLISIFASVKQTKDNSTEGILELKTGMKAGILTAFIICLFLGTFNFVYQRTIPVQDILTQSEASLKDYYKENPVKDTTAKNFQRAAASFDSSSKAGDFRYARFMLEKAKIIDPTFDKDGTKTNYTNNKLMESVTSWKNQLSLIFRQWFFFQLIIGMFISFVVVMIYRSRQQSGL